MIRSRLAPTPSGYLHAGNAVNFAITAALTRALGGELRLRIDDLDAERVRPECTTDIFETLAWLGVSWKEGPQTAGGAGAFSQQKRVERYIRLTQQLIATGQVYACTCTRSEVQQRTGGLVYDRFCRRAQHALNGDAVLRFALPDAPVVVTDILRGKFSVDLQNQSGDPVIRRRDGLTAYHVASLADDLDYEINLIVRGEDLLASTATQLALAQALGDTGKSFRETKFLHHALITGAGGTKLSKSQGDSPLRELRQRGETAAFVFREAAALLRVNPADTLGALTDAVKEIVRGLV